MILRRLLIIATIVFNLLPAFSQEVVVPLSDNPALTNAQKFRSRVKAATQDTVALPFFDEFSGYTYPYPNPSLWTDNFVYINDKRADNPLSVGVATFDALDENGKIYSRASAKPFVADMLTSKPILMDYPVGSNAYLSFYYQPQGIGDTVEVQDSLFVDFYNPASKMWWTVWKMKGSGVHPFKAAIIPVDADSFLVRGFQFRFRNNASIATNSDIPGKMGDVDQWHIDYVKLNINRTATDTIMRDVAISKPIGSLLKTYQSMPWKHFQVAFQNVMRQGVDITYRNNDTTIHKPNIHFRITDLRGTSVTSIDPGDRNIYPQEVLNITTNLEYPFLTNETDSALFEVKSFLETDAYDIKDNDTTRFQQVFSNYFAYDDGSPENGYGLSGHGTSNGMVAYKFTTSFADTLRAINIFFNSTQNNVTADYPFQLTVWKATTGGPGQMIYQSQQKLPSDFGKYTTYALDSGIIVNGDFFIGWQQPNEDFLNVGLDKNNSTEDKLYYSIGAWTKSYFNNSALMIRPVFGSKGIISSDDPGIEKTDFKIYPNPCDGVLHIEKPSELNNPLYATLLNMTGKTVLQTEVNENTINLENLPTGLYLLVLTDDGKTVYKSKVLVQH